MRTKQTIKVIEHQIEKASKKLQNIASQKRRLEAQESPLLEDLKAYQRVLASLTGKSRSKEPIATHRVVESKTRGRKSKQDIGLYLRYPLRDGQEHRLQDILASIKGLHGVVVARSTARSHFERMPDVEKLPGRLVYKLKGSAVHVRVADQLRLTDQVTIKKAAP